MNIFLIFINAFWVFNRPPSKKILFYDKNGLDIVLPFFLKSSYHIYHSRGEVINLYVLFLTIIKSGIINLKQNYKKNYLNIVNPKFIFTCIDVNPAFYYLKEHTKAKTILVQSSYRDEQALRFEFVKNKSIKAKVDYMCVFGESVKKIFSKFIQGKVIVTGNLKNNIINNMPIEKNTLLFISQFKSGRIFPKNEKIILKILANFCYRKSLKLLISTKLLDNDQNGLAEYKKILGDNGWQCFPRINNYSSYEIMTKSEFIVFADSTLGYEALSRKKKILSLAFGSNMYNWCKKNCAHQIIPFGYPLNLPSEGPFWLNTFSKKKIYSKLDEMITRSQLKWDEIFHKFNVDDLIKYDGDNKAFYKLLREFELL